MSLIISYNNKAVVTRGMLKTATRMMWVGGVGAQPSLTNNLRNPKSMYVGVTKEVVRGNISAEARRIYGKDVDMTDRFVLCPKIYDDLLKLPLRYKLHPYEVVAKNIDAVVGYGLPLGPADIDDTIPFHAHRESRGRLPGDMHSINARNLDPHFITRFRMIDGDLFRFEDELIKIFPTKKTFVRSHEVVVYNTAADGIRVAQHWLLGLGF